MKKIRGFVIALVITTALTSKNPSGIAQDVSRSFRLKIDTHEKTFIVGEKPIATVDITNLTEHEIVPLCAPYRVHVEMVGGVGPTMTELSRHHWRRLLPGDKGDYLVGSNFCPGIAGGATRTQKYNLAQYYDLSKPGTYRVYVEINDEEHSEKGPETWINSGTAQFKVTSGMSPIISDKK